MWVLVIHDLAELVPLLLIVIATLVALRYEPGRGRLPQAIGAIVVLGAKVAHLVCLHPQIGLLSLSEHRHPLVWLGLWLMSPWVVTLGWLAFAVGMLLAATDNGRVAGSLRDPQAQS